TPTHRAGYCAFYGECGPNPDLKAWNVSSQVPCLSNTPARVATGTLLSLLRSVCPDLARGDSETTKVCCTYEQLRALQLSVAISGAVLARCPSCARNFASIYCHNTCSPDQSLFINVTRVAKPKAEQSMAVVEYQSFYRQRFADEAFASCRGVRLPATGGFAISTMCGRYGAQFCTPQRWLDFQGDTSNGLAPLDIDFQLVPNGTVAGDGIEPLDARVWRCAEAPSAQEEPCSCQDCAAACPPLVPPTDPPPPFRLGEADGVLVICILVFAVLAIVFLVALLCQRGSKAA
ncbi:NPCL1 protein, partial [Grallaria varia]|nr:NPCL1 protein [Grallaria varia]